MDACGQGSIHGIGGCGILDRVTQELPLLPVAAQPAARADEFLRARPHRFHSAEQLGALAWADPALSQEQVRNYVARLRRIPARLEAPYELVNRPSRGYSLVLRADG